jgi:predicted lipid-binding transport protein (Tim44 family)
VVIGPAADALRLAHVFARAGGGQGFGGGGGDVGGGGGGGGGFPLFFLGGGALAEGGSIVTVVVAVGALLLAVMWASRNRRRPETAGGIVEHPYPHSDAPAYRPGTIPGIADGPGGGGGPARWGGPAGAAGGGPAGAPGGGPAAAGLAAIKAHDPDFDVDRFKSSVERSFFVVEEGWSECKPEMTRRVMADGIWQQHRVQIEQYQHNGTRNMLDGLAVGKVTIRAAASDAHYDTVTARILATCADYDVEVATGKVVRGNKHEMTPFQEDWVFERSSSATTKADGGTMEQRCPNCGAPLDVDLAGNCHYCRAPVMSGDFDWVLTRIDQV